MVWQLDDGTDNLFTENWSRRSLVDMPHSKISAKSIKVKGFRLHS